MKVEKGQKFIITVEGTGYLSDNSTLFSTGIYISEKHLTELIENGKLIPVKEEE